MSKNNSPLSYDEIRVYESEDSPPSSRYRWTRRTTTNWRVVGTSSEGYARVRGALANIERTQRGPYTLILDVKRKS